MRLSIVDSLLSACLPRRCLLCNSPSGDLQICRGCADDMPWTGNSCDGCGRRLPDGYRTGFCGKCKPGNRRPGPVFCALSYEYPVDQLIIGAKFRRLPVYACVLGELLSLALEHRDDAGLLVRPDLLVPVPLHRTRLASRGFNQTAEIARMVARRFDLPTDETSCRRTRATREQSGLSGPDRRRNVHGAFSASAGVAGKHVAIIDDVLTTGSTVLALAAALREAGTERIQVWTVARSVDSGKVSSVRVEALIALRP